MREVFLYCLRWDRVHVVDALQIVVAHQLESCEPEESVEDVDLIAWSVSEASGFRVLAVHHITLKCGEVNPLLPLYHEAA